MHLISWNLNGIRAAQRKGFVEWLDRVRPDVLCVQETKAHPEQLDEALLREHGYHVTWSSAVKRGYSGVATFSKVKPDEVHVGLGVEKFDNEGRMIQTRYGKLQVIGAYFPNGQNDHARVPFKMEFTEAIFARAKALREEGFQVVVCGDWNTAHTPMDLARPSQNRKTTGFLPKERAQIDAWLAGGFVDIFRAMHPEQAGAYSWWSFRSGARQRNVGWRIDYFLVSEDLRDKATRAEILSDVMGSDHCPVSLHLELS